MFRLLRKFFQAPYHTQVAALSLCSHVKSLFSFRFCLQPERCLAASLDVRSTDSQFLTLSKVSPKIKVSLITPHALLHTAAHGQGTFQPQFLIQALLMLSPASPSIQCLPACKRILEMSP